MPRRHRALEEILTLDPDRDHRRIVYLDTFYEFPFDTTRSLEFALFRTFAAPSMSARLAASGEFEARPVKRYDDTDLILSEILEHGYDSERGRAALRRMNQMHGRFPISNEDFVYVLSTFIFEPIRWNERFGWRRMVEQERLAQYTYWRTIGGFMNIKDIPASFDAYEQFNRAYEREHFRYSETNRRIADVTRDMFVEMFFGFMPRRLAESMIYALLDDPLIEAFGYPQPSRGMRWLVASALQTRARIVALLPERRKPFLRTALKRPQSYPRGYSFPTELGVHYTATTIEESQAAK